MSQSYSKRDSCRLCNSRNLQKALSLVPSALCDAYIKPEHLNKTQEIYPLDLLLCNDCGYVFLHYVVDPDIIYRDYIYVTTSSMGLSKHFKGYADNVLHQVHLLAKSLVIDIGSNDGTFLKFFKNAGMRVLGIEPAIAIAKTSEESGIETIAEFFSVELSERIKKDYGLAKLITANNIFANIDNLEEMMKGIRELIAPDGIFIIESSYLGDMIKNMVFDFIYHEHLSYFSVKPLSAFLDRFGMELINIERVPTKGGSLRYYSQPKGGPAQIMPIIDDMIEEEEIIGLTRLGTFKIFAEKINDIRFGLIKKLKNLKARGKKIAGYGGSATSTTLMYHFGLAKILDYIVDDNPAKENTFSPGYHIPILSSKAIYEKKVDYILILAWRYADQIIKKHRKFSKQGGRFIIPLPTIKVI